MAKLQSLFRQIRQNFRYIAKWAVSGTCSLIAGIQILVFLCDLDMVFPDDLIFSSRVLVSIAVVLGIWCVLFIVKAAVVLVAKQADVISVSNGSHVYVEYGDLLEDRGGECSVIIPANRCFDTLVDNDLISETTVHGQAVQKICAAGITADELCRALQKDLRDNRRLLPEQELTRSEKRSGNLQRYPVGSIAEFKKDGEKTTYVFLGMSAFNSALHPETTDEEYALTVQRLMEHCWLRSQRFPVYMPVIGTNGRNNQKSERELLEYMVSVFRFHKHLINTDIHIVVYSKHRDRVSIQGL